MDKAATHGTGAIAAQHRMQRHEGEFAIQGRRPAGDVARLDQLTREGTEDLDPVRGRRSQRGFAAELSRAGYDTALIGKAHFATAHTFAPTGSPECRHSMHLYGPNWTGPYMGFQRVELVVEGHNTFPPMTPPYGQSYEAWYHGDGYGELKNRLYKENAAPT